MKTTKWLGVIFESSCSKTEQFKAFVRDFRSDLKSMLKTTGWSVYKMNVMHFELSAFLYNERLDAWVYIAISDVRFFRDAWNNDMLFRSAKSARDFSGGVNQYCQFSQLSECLGRMADRYERNYSAY